MCLFHVPGLIHVPLFPSAPCKKQAQHLRSLSGWLQALLRNFRAEYPQGRIISDEPLGPDLPSTETVLQFVLRVGQKALSPLTRRGGRGGALTREHAALLHDLLVSSMLSCFTPSIRLYVLRTLQIYSAPLR